MEQTDLHSLASVVSVWVIPISQRSDFVIIYHKYKNSKDAVFSEPHATQNTAVRNYLTMHMALLIAFTRSNMKIASNFANE